MEPYANLSGDSPIREFELGADFIQIRYRNDPHIYTYDRHRPGAEHVERMKVAAREGRGLATYISQHVKGNYASKSELP